MEEQLSLLPLDSPLRGSVKNERFVMVYNFFALTKERRTDPIVYQDGNVKIEVKSGADGIATIYDKEFLIYVASLLVDKINRGLEPTQTCTITGNDYFRVTRQDNNKKSYERLALTLERLQGTQVKTNIETGGEGQDEWFSWLKSAKTQYRKLPDGGRELKSITIEICDWLYRAIVKDSRMLTYDPAFFDLPPLEKRLYEIARAHCGNQAGFKINLEKLRLRVGSEDQAKNFKAKLIKKSAQKNVIPEYGFKVVDRTEPGRRADPKKALVVFWRLERWRDYNVDEFGEVEA